MAFTDPIGDMITRIRNAQQRKKETVLVPVSKLKKGVLDVLVQEGYIVSYSEIGDTVSRAMFKIHLKYYRSRPVIREIKRVSKPSVHFYQKFSDKHRVVAGLGNAILTTSRGIMSDVKARALGVGGKILLTVW
ncbi:30S ribosomal protein S8 [Holospora curviuscula]|uniref:Small ribosomal subunit protein uS8 n=1 Tax=Holospora curviuscula TaxID=1082868 RepID=A0A2S5R939_9PROT|nr:30S ribosomal protein S8 [Holospora curviuscula]PPE03645.1 30S ribosomal protein S8 [Holospora curviuscula]